MAITSSMRACLAVPGAALVALVILRPLARGAEGPAEFFENRIRPLLIDNCYRCHGADKQRGNLRLDSRDAILHGGDQGPAIIPGKPQESLLLRAVHHSDNLKMPPKKQLSRRQIADLEQWVQGGAVWGDTRVIGSPTKPPSDPDRPHWAFQPVRRPRVPTPKDSSRIGNPIDAFVVQRLESKGLHLSPPATRRELLRRVYFDLIGLPPTSQEVDAFEKDDRRAAFEEVVDRLLASPHYGERWGRHWLDLVRFGQTHGYERDDEKPNAWRYRDYVIRAFNADRPYDQFIREQLAGDEMEPRTDDARIATAFYRIGVWDDEPDDAKQAEFDALDDILSTTGEAFLGLTIGCARCHDHKFDPIRQEDYYSLLAFCRNIGPTVRDKPVSITVPLDAGGSTLAVKEPSPTAPPTHLLIRGNAATLGKEVSPRFLPVLCATKQAQQPRITPPVDNNSSGRRLALARWIASADNPLTARVLVNRLWQHHFGRGLVATPSDFGRNGSPPSHPDLLDWLATSFIEDGWSIKRLHRRILLSNTYRQSSRIADETAAAIDPDNALLWRQNLRRLEAETIRDAILATSGRLCTEMGGRGIFPTLPPEVLSTQSRPGAGWGKSTPTEQGRRSVYIYVKRTLGVPLLDTFDFASPDKPVAARATTTIAPQALILLNSAFTEEQSLDFAHRLLRECGSRPEANVEEAFRLALSRRPSAQEKATALAYLDRAKATFTGSDGYRQALARLCKIVLNLNEFVYVD
jgi:hypothetical protein